MNTCRAAMKKFRMMLFMTTSLIRTNLNQNLPQSHEGTKKCLRGLITPLISRRSLCLGAFVAAFCFPEFGYLML
jgi:hypothetical protein